jgi:hypothetical protein
VPADHPVRAVLLANLTAVLWARYTVDERPDDLRRAVEWGREALAATPVEHPNRALCALNFARAMRSRFEDAADPHDLREAVDALRNAANLRSAPARTRMAAAQELGELAASVGDDVVSAAGYAAAVQLLPQVAWRGVDRRTREQQPAAASGVAADAGALAIRCREPRRAVELLEEGRSVLWMQTLQLRDDLAELAAARPDLAAHLQRVRVVLDT